MAAEPTDRRVWLWRPPGSPGSGQNVPVRCPMGARGRVLFSRAAARAGEAYFELPDARSSAGDQAADEDLQARRGEPARSVAALCGV